MSKGEGEKCGESMRGVSRAQGPGVGRRVKEDEQGTGFLVCTAAGAPSMGATFWSLLPDNGVKQPDSGKIGPPSLFSGCCQEEHETTTTLRARW